MQLEHVALNIFDSNEVNSFYENILGFKLINNFNINKELAQCFFNIDKDASAYQMQNNDLVFELFVNNNYMNNSFSHVCIKVNNREEMVEKANSKFIQIYSQGKRAF